MRRARLPSGACGAPMLLAQPCSASPSFPSLRRALGEALGFGSSTNLYAYEFLLSALAVGLLVALVRGPGTEHAVADLVVELGGGSDAGTLRGRLARALGDPSLELGYWLDESSSYVDERGRALPLPPRGSGRQVTEIGRDGRPLAVMVNEGSVLADPGFLEGVAAAVRIAVANVRLQARDPRAARGDHCIPPPDPRRPRHATTSARAGVPLRTGASAGGSGADAASGVLRGFCVGPKSVDRRPRRGAGRACLRARRVAPVRERHPSRCSHRAGSRRSTGPTRPPRGRPGAAGMRRRAIAGTDRGCSVLRLLRGPCESGQARPSVAGADHGLVGAGTGGRLGARRRRRRSRPERRLGLEGLADRVEALGGTLRLESSDGRGTLLVAELPLTP